MYRYSFVLRRSMGLWVAIFGIVLTKQELQVGKWCWGNQTGILQQRSIINGHTIWRRGSRKKKTRSGRDGSACLASDEGHAWFGAP